MDYFHWVQHFLNIFIWPIDRIVTGTTAPGQSRPGNYSKETVFILHRCPGMESHHQMLFSVILCIFHFLVGGGLTR